MGVPRQVLPNSFYLISRRCSQRQFLLRPDDATNNAYLYCLIEAALRSQIDLVMMCAMSNHHHVVIYDRLGNYPQFIEHLHKMIARSQNALRGRWEHFWASGQTSVVRLEDAGAVLDKVTYVACNPVNDDLVARVDQWPGVNGYRALMTGQTLRAKRPIHFFRKDGPMPEAVETALRVPDEIGDSDAFRRALEARVTEIETQMDVARERECRRVLGRRAVLAQNWTDTPETFEPRRQLSPRIATKNLWNRVAAIIRNRWFARAYATARAAWLAGEAAVFPVGTYWLRRFAGVSVES